MIGPIRVTVELWVYRIRSFNISGRDDSFHKGVRARDRKCVISGVVNGRTPECWVSFMAAHVFPSKEKTCGVKGYITNMDNTLSMSKINSCQNGFLLWTHIHELFDQYLISVYPYVISLHSLNCVVPYELLQDGFKVVVFDLDLDRLDGQILDPVYHIPDNPHRISDPIMRWHFRQCVLANTRGTGEPSFENDFPPGTDMMKEIREGPYPQEGLELELAARLGVSV